MKQLTKLALSCLAAIIAAQLAMSAGGLAQDAPKEQKLKVKQSTGLVSIGGPPTHPDVIFDCRKGTNVAVELPATGDSVTWVSQGCLCADDAATAKNFLLSQLKYGRFSAELLNKFLQRNVPVKPGETQQLRLYCYNAKEIYEQFKE